MTVKMEVRKCTPKELAKAQKMLNKPKPKEIAWNPTSPDFILSIHEELKKSGNL